jgi:hypothetical protein
MNKHLALVNGTQVHDLAFGPGTSPEDVRRQLNLPAELLISRRDGLPFAEGEDLYGQVREGEKLYASPPAVVGTGVSPSGGAS